MESVIVRFTRPDGSESSDAYVNMEFARYGIMYMEIMGYTCEEPVESDSQIQRCFTEEQLWNMIESPYGGDDKEVLESVVKALEKDLSREFDQVRVRLLREAKKHIEYQIDNIPDGYGWYCDYD